MVADDNGSKQGGLSHGPRETLQDHNSTTPLEPPNSTACADAESSPLQDEIILQSTHHSFPDESRADDTPPVVNIGSPAAQTVKPEVLPPVPINVSGGFDNPPSAGGVQHRADAVSGVHATSNGGASRPRQETSGLKRGFLGTPPPPLKNAAASSNYSSKASPLSASVPGTCKAATSADCAEEGKINILDRNGAYGVQARSAQDEAATPQSREEDMHKAAMVTFSASTLSGFTFFT